MPHFSENLQGLRVSFYARPENSSSGVLHVGYITNPADSSTFVSVYQIDPTFLSDNNYHQYIVDFSSQTAPDSARIAFRYVTNSEWYFLLDDITVSIIPNCFAPLQLSSTGVTSTTVNLTWLSNIDTLELYYKYAAEPDWNMEIAALDSTGYYHLTGLTPSKTYTWYVVAPCDGNLFESATSTFTTVQDSRPKHNNLRALHLSPTMPNSHFDIPYAIPPTSRKFPNVDFEMPKSCSSPGIADEKFFRMK